MLKIPKINMNLDKLGNILLILGCVYYVTNCGGPKEVAVIPEGYISEQESEYRIKVKEQENKIKEYETQFIQLKEAYEKDTAILNHADHSTLTDFFADRYERER